jgi:hypothetical protein
MCVRASGLLPRKAAVLHEVVLVRPGRHVGLQDGHRAPRVRKHFGAMSLTVNRFRQLDGVESRRSAALLASTDAYSSPGPLRDLATVDAALIRLVSSRRTFSPWTRSFPESRRTLKYSRPVQVTSRMSASPTAPASTASGAEGAGIVNISPEIAGMRDRPSLGQARAALLHGDVRRATYALQVFRFLRGA